MPKYLVSLALLFCTLYNQAYSGARDGVELHVGTFYLGRLQRSIEMFNVDLGSTLQTSPFIYTINLDASSTSVNADGDSHASFSYFHPQLVSSGSDSYSLKGFYFSHASGGDLLDQKDWIDLIITAGWNWGRQTLRRNGEMEAKYRNVFFAPKLASALRFNFNHLAVTVRSEGQLDITNPRWKKKTGIDYSINSTKYHLWTLSAGIGYLF